jgi:hypothetical protein
MERFSHLASTTQITNLKHKNFQAGNTKFCLPETGKYVILATHQMVSTAGSSEQHGR